MRLRLPGRAGRPSGPAPGHEDGSGADEFRYDDAAVTSGGVDVGHVRTASPAPSSQRGARLQAAARRLAIVSAQLLLMVAALIVIGYVLGRLWVILLPIVLGLLFTTVLWPLARFLRAHRWPPALAAAVVMLGFLATFGGVIALIAPPVVDQVGELADAATSGLQDIQDWLSGPPFNIGDSQIDQAVDSAINTLQSNAQNIAGYGLTAASMIGNGLINLLLALVLAFFFLKDGPRWVPWLSAQTGPRAAPHVIALSHRTWTTLSEFIRQQALVGFVDAFFIGLGLLLLGVPLVLPLAVLTFFGAFIPIIGAFVAGGFAVLIALVSNGFTTALAVLGIVVVVQQIEGNVLQPIIQGRGFNLHPAVVILAVTAGASLAGIIGAFLGVPVAALIAVVYRYVRDQLDGRGPEVDDAGERPQVTADGSGARVTTEPAGTPADPAPGSPGSSGG
ncbi:AI-2E family transporter [Geodermatophilus sp. YIM 151500]|uniref:AI-2E family transporter n=1 Tax=Geodermatophilus sp. YIM 151500 TaxID=2984531 RepID=UPI0021E3DD5C|nr:AI-2E family transporter [Geodermatophilus sp. YIM 151500]MCV2487937.1 AI-2E family transporter [Geodermatophilus sp. YIM 151500]